MSFLLITYKSIAGNLFTVEEECTAVATLLDGSVHPLGALPAGCGRTCSPRFYTEQQTFQSDSLYANLEPENETSAHVFFMFAFLIRCQVLSLVRGSNTIQRYTLYVFECYWCMLSSHPCRPCRRHLVFLCKPSCQRAT